MALGFTQALIIFVFRIMKTHDIKRMFKIAQKFDAVRIEYQTETHDSWRTYGKLTSFEIDRPPFPEKYGNWYRLAEIKLVFDDERVYWAYGLERFADRDDKFACENFVGLVGCGFEGQYVYLKIFSD